MKPCSTPRLRTPSAGPLALALATLLALASGCGAASDSAGFTYQNGLFSRTSALQAAADGPAAAPNLSWPATGRRLVVAGFFGKRIDVRQNLITNQSDLLWMWHSGMDGGREGNVLWQNGAPARWGQPLVGQAPAPLAPGTYYWAVWALDDTGKPVQSTVELTHTVP